MIGLLLSVALGTAPFATQAAPEAGETVPSDPRVLTIPYEPDQVVRLQGATDVQTTLLFGPDELVENVAIGRSDAWQATLNGRGDALFLKPLQVGVVTNMTVITNERAYAFELTSTFSLEPNTPFVVRLADPAEQASQPARRYRLGGARALRPASVHDDGIRTFIQWRSDQPIPAVFGVDERGEEVLLQGQFRRGDYVLDSVHRALVFRLDGQAGRATRLRAGSGR